MLSFQTEKPSDFTLWTAIALRLQAGVRGGQGFGQAREALAIDDIVDPPALDRTARQSQQDRHSLSGVVELRPRHAHNVWPLPVLEYLDVPKRQVLEFLTVADRVRVQIGQLTSR